jgi:hypothetical protein
MLNGKKRAIAAKFLNYAFIILFACSLASIFFYGNFLMINRPIMAIASQGFLYPFFGKGGAIFISKLDCEIMIGSIALLLISMIGANRCAKIEVN